MNIKKLLPYTVTEKRLYMGDDWYGAVIGDVVSDDNDDNQEYATVTVKSIRWLGLELMYHYSVDS